MKKVLFWAALFALLFAGPVTSKPLLDVSRAAVGVKAMVQDFAPNHTHIPVFMPQVYVSYTTTSQTSVDVSYARDFDPDTKYGLFKVGVNMSLYGYEPGSRGPQIGIGAKAVRYENLESVYTAKYPWDFRVDLGASYGLVQDGHGKTILYLSGQAGLSPKNNVPDFQLALNFPVVR